MKSLHVDVAERRIAIVVPGLLRGSELGDGICRRIGAWGLRLSFDRRAELERFLQAYEALLAATVANLSESG